MPKKVSYSFGYKPEGSGLTFLMEIEKKGKSRLRRMAICLCECGELKEVLIDNWKSSHTKTCGCLQREVASNNRKNTAYREPSILMFTMP